MDQQQPSSENPDMRFPRASDPELLDVIRRYVIPEEGDDKRYLKLLDGNFAAMDEPKRAAFLRSLTEAAEQITDYELGVLLDSEWRSRITAAWLIGVSRRTQVRERLGELLLESGLIYAGQGYCFTLAYLGTIEDAEILTAYLDRYLRRPECRYDQHWALGALLHIDDRLGTNHALQFLRPKGLWEQWAQGQLDATEQKQRVDALCSLVSEASLATGAERGMNDPA